MKEMLFDLYIKQFFTTSSNGKQIPFLLKANSSKTFSMILAPKLLFFRKRLNNCYNSLFESLSNECSPCVCQ